MKPNKKRLLLLAAKLERLAKSKRGRLPKFDLREWAFQRLERKGQTPTELHCATAACAVGTAMLMPEFRKQGLKCYVRHNAIMIPTFRGHENWGAIDSFFLGIKDPKLFRTAESKHLFEDEQYPESQRTGRRGMKAVAKRIREFVKTGSIDA